MSFRTLAFAGAVSLLLAQLAGCNTILPPRAVVDYKASYDFQPVWVIAITPEDVGEDGGLELSDEQTVQIVQSLERALVEGGYTTTAERETADLVLNWHVVAREKADVRSYNASSYYQCWRCGPSLSNVSIRRYTEGTLIVDLVDPRLNKSVWRGVLQGHLDDALAAPGQQERLDEVARQVLSKFPPG